LGGGIEPPNPPFANAGLQIEEDEMDRESCVPENYKQASLEGKKLFK